MKYQLLSIVTLVLCVDGLVAFPTRSSSPPNVARAAHDFQAPEPDDSRGPCPGLNTLANHGYLPQNGKNITIPIVLKAAMDGFNVDPNALATAAKAGLLTTNEFDNFNLQDLALHGTIEHDASLSRSDFALGDNLHFNESVFSTLNNSNPGVDYYNATSAGLVQKERLALDSVANPNITNTIKEFTIRTVESALYLSVMGDPTTGVAPKKFVQIFFQEERMPFAEGWKRPTVTTTLDTLGNIGLVIVNTSDWAPSGAQTNPWVRLSPQDNVNPLAAGAL